MSTPPVIPMTMGIQNRMAQMDSRFRPSASLGTGGNDREGGHKARPYEFYAPY